jgi:hypothetical protein
MVGRIAALLALGAFASLGLAALPPTNDPSRITISSVLDRGDSYLAITTQGLYRAAKSDEIWQKLPHSPPLTFMAHLTANTANPSEIACFTGADSMFAGHEPWKVGLYLSKDNGATWRGVKIDGDPVDVFIHPNGSIFLAAHYTTTTPPPGPDASWSESNGVKHYNAERLLVTHDDGATWTDITPHLNSNFGLYGIFRDPDHPDLVCVRSAEMGHISHTFLYQAMDAHYAWSGYHDEDWHHGAAMNNRDFYRPLMGGANNSDMPANLENFFKFPYLRNGSYPSLPTRFLVADHDNYTFHLHRPMPISAKTVWMVQQPALTLDDNRNETVFWSIRAIPEDGPQVFLSPKSAELNWDIPNREAVRQKYLHDPQFITAAADQAHPYQRIIDLEKLYDFPKPDRYRLQVTYADLYLRPGGSVLGTPEIDITVLP